jgi:glycerol-3-phosphate dehydrogenase
LESLNDNSQVWDFSRNLEPKHGGWEDDLRQLISEESVIHLDDLVFRRTTLWENPGRVIDMAPQLCSLFDWDRDKSEYEMKRVAALVNDKRTN